MNRGAGYLLLALAAGCGSLGAPAASDDTPNTGVAGWRKLSQRPGTSIQEPYVLCSGGNSFTAPDALRLSDGSFAMWYVTPAGAIGSATGDDGIYDWSDRGLATLPDAGPWGEVSVAEDDAGLLMAATASDSSRVAFFRSTDGLAWTAAGTLVPSQAWQDGVIGGAELLHDGNAWILYFDGNHRGAIGRADSADGSTWTVGAAPLFTVAEARAAGWPVVEIGSPAAGLDTSRPGPPLYKLWFTGREVHGPFPPIAEWSIGFAGSFDGMLWELYGENPVLGQVIIDAPGLPIRFADERKASVIALPGDDYLMFFEQPFDDVTSGTVRPCVALATTT